MAAPAEVQIETFNAEQIGATPLVFVLSEMDEDTMVRHRAAKFISDCLLSSETDEVPTPTAETERTIDSLLDAIRLAAEGNETAREMIRTNVRTDVIERIIKTGHVLRVELDVDYNGKIHQFGQSANSIHANSLKLASNSEKMLKRTKAETTNQFRIEQCLRQGLLDNYYFVVFSRAPDDMTTQEMDEIGFFTETMSFAIQATTVDGGAVITESAFVAGVKSPGEDRHDEETIVAVGDMLGVDFRGKSPTEIIDTPILINKSQMSNGTIDLAELCDIVADGTFFGEDKPAQDYLEYLEVCKEREDLYEAKVDAIVEELIKAAPKLRNKLQAINLLNKLSGQHMIEQAVFDETINPSVFGPQSSADILEARAQISSGNYEAGLTAISRAKKNDNSSSCPAVLRKENDPLDELSDGDLDEEHKTESEECEFVSKECPKCGAKNVKTTVTKKEIKGDCGCVVKK